MSPCCTLFRNILIHRDWHAKDDINNKDNGHNGDLELYDTDSSIRERNEDWTNIWKDDAFECAPVPCVALADDALI